MAPTAPIASTATAVATSPPPPAAPTPFGGRHIAIGIALTTGLVGMAMGVGYGITFEMARDSYKKDCNPDLCRDGRTNQRTYEDTMALLLPEGISFVAGGAGLAAAGVLYLTLPQSGGRSESVRIAPQIGPNHAVIAASGSF
jgi:hypothetical protein